MTPFERQIPPEPEELGPARAALTIWLHEVGVEEDAAIADVLVVASELLTNGVIHDGGDLITLKAERLGSEVSIEVTTVDHRHRQHPTYRDVETSVEGGRGLSIVRALSDGYRVVRHDHERVTTCEVDASAAPQNPTLAATGSDGSPTP